MRVMASKSLFFGKGFQHRAILLDELVYLASKLFIHPGCCEWWLCRRDYDLALLFVHIHGDIRAIVKSQVVQCIFRKRYNQTVPGLKNLS